MHGDRPLIGKNRLLLIRQVEASHVIVEIGSMLYRARYMATTDSPSRCQLQPGDYMLALNVNLQAVHPMTITERLDQRTRTGDGCQYTFYDYEAIAQRDS
jgi:hypothetical protein